MPEITDFGPRKTIFILAIVAGCFAVLWPKIFYPMLTASVTPHHTSDSSGKILISLLFITRLQYFILCRYFYRISGEKFNRSNINDASFIFD